MLPLPPFLRPYVLGLSAALAGLLILQCSSWIRHEPNAAVPTACEAWDEAAQRSLAPLTHRPQIAVADRPLLASLAALRRARHDCATGRLDLAKRDYDVLQGAASVGVSEVAQDQDE